LLFTADNRITDEAAQACQVCGVDPKDLVQQKSDRDSKWEEKARQTKMVIVANYV
jgi:hypothetical protein